MKRKICILAAPLLMAVEVNAASVSLEYDNLDWDGGSVSSGSLARSNAIIGSSPTRQRHTTFTVTGVDLNDDAITDTFSFVMQVSANGGTGDVLVNSGHYTVDSSLMESGESLSFIVSDLTFTNGAGGEATAAPTISFDGFDGVTIRVGTNAPTENININGGSTIGLSSNPEDLVLADLSALTVNALDATDGGTTGVRVDRIDLGFSFTSVPEPSTTALIGLGGLALMMRRRV